MNRVRKPAPRASKGVLYFRNISPHVKSLFKSVAYRRGDNMNDVVQALMELYVKDPACVKIPKRR